MTTKAFQKGLSVVLLICVCALLFCSCGGAGTQSTGQTSGGSDAESNQTSQGNSNLEFKLTWEGDSYQVTGIGSATEREIAIPSTYAGLPVTEIAEGAFKDCTGITSVTIPDSVIYIGSSAFQGCTGLTGVTIPDGVARIGDSAFQDCSALTSVTIPGSMTGIAHSLFRGCSALTGVTIPDSVTEIDGYAFAECIGLTSVVIPNRVTTVGQCAFMSCTELLSVTIGSGVTSIDGSAFYECFKLVEVYNLSNLDITAGVWSSNGHAGSYAKAVHTSLSEPSILTTTADGYTFYSLNGESALLGYSGGETTLRLPDSFIIRGQSVTTYKIYPYALYENKQVTSVTISDAVTAIGSQAFQGCSRLASLTIGNNVTSIGSGAFQDCIKLGSVVFPNKVTEIGYRAFYGCTDLLSVTLGTGVTSIDESAFYLCYKLVEIYNLSDAIQIGIGDINNGFIGTYAKTVHDDQTDESILTTTSEGYVFCYADRTWYLISYTGSGTRLTLPSSFLYDIIVPVSSYAIYPWAFYANTQLTSVTLPGSVTDIGDCAFYGCSGLTSVTIGGGVRSIGEDAFAFCTALTSVTIGSNVTEICEFAFNSCTALTSVTIPDSVTIISTFAFYDCSELATVFIGTTGWYQTRQKDATSGTAVDLSDPAAAANCFLTMNEDPSPTSEYFKRNG